MTVAVAAILGVTTVLCTLTWGIINYNLQTNKMMFENGYVEAYAPSTIQTSKVWVKTNSNGTINILK